MSLIEMCREKLSPALKEVARKGTDKPQAKLDDATSEFNGRVTDAVDHFKEHSDDVRVVMLKSSGEDKWYQNSPEKPSEFRPMEEATDGDTPLFRGPASI